MVQLQFDELKSQRNEIRSTLASLVSTMSATFSEKGRFPSQTLPNPQSGTSSTTNPINNPQNYHEQAKSITTLRSGKTFENLSVPPPNPSPISNPTPLPIIPPFVEKPIPLEKEENEEKLKKKKKNVS